MAQTPVEIAPSLEELAAYLRPYGQEHLLAHWPQLEYEHQKRLAEQLQAIDFDEIQKLHAESKSHQAHDWRAIAERSELPPSLRLEGDHPEFTREQARNAGAKALTSGQVGVILVAGGQASRLGFDKPKGTFPIGPISGASLYQILAEMVVATNKRYRVSVPLYVMTSPATHNDTVDFFREHRCFGLQPSEVHFFCQGTMPAIDAETGKLLMSAPGELALSPDGHGGMVTALHKSGLIDHMRARGIDYVFFLQVDNPLVSVCDPEFLGAHILSQSQISVKVIEKIAPDEKLGNVVLVDGRMQILEYSDLPRDLAERQTPNGHPIFWAGNIAVHYFDREILARAATGDETLPFHVARKRMSHVDDAGNRIDPGHTNAIKFERFIFDIFPIAERVLVVETDREAEYAAVKNASGDYSPASVKAQMSRVHARWLSSAGVKLPPDAIVEISPLWALDPIEAREKVASLKVDGKMYLR